MFITPIVFIKLCQIGGREGKNNDVLVLRLGVFLHRLKYIYNRQIDRDRESRMQIDRKIDREKERERKRERERDKFCRV